ncbi:MAG: hypothetical protein ABIH41_04350, partial [Nanoarchaeota archaeon]
MRRDLLQTLIIMAVWVLLSQPCSALRTTMTTEAGSSAILTVPEIPRTGTTTATLQYYPLNALVNTVSIKASWGEQQLLDSSWPTDDIPSSIELKIQADQESTSDLTITITETTDTQEYITETSVPVRIYADTFRLDTHDIYGTIVKGSTQGTIDDLSIYEPIAYQDKVDYEVTRSIANQVKCAIIHDTVLALDAGAGFSGEAACTIKATLEGESQYITYHIFVGTDADASDYMDAHQTTTPTQNSPTHQDLTRRFTFNTARDDGQEWTSAEGTTIRATTPDTFTQGEESAFNLLVTLDPSQPTIIESLFIIPQGDAAASNPPVEVTCTPAQSKQCDASITLTFTKEMTADIAIVAKLVDKADLPDTRWSSNGINITTGGQDIVLTSLLRIPVHTPAPDLPLGGIGIITPDQNAEAAILLNEVGRVTDESFLEHDEIESAHKIAEIYSITKDADPVERINSQGDRETHTLITITLEKKEEGGLWQRITHKKHTATAIRVYEHIPKTIAGDISEISVDHEANDQMGATFQIINADPLVVWHFDNPPSEANIKYEVNGEASQTSTNTYMTGDVKTSLPSILWGLLLIPLVAG